MTGRFVSKTMRVRAWRAVDATIHSGSATYVRAHLARLIPVGPGECAATDVAATRHILLKLARAMRGERARGKAGHWMYDLNRHIGLAQAYRVKKARLKTQTDRKAKK